MNKIDELIQELMKECKKQNKPIVLAVTEGVKTQVKTNGSGAGLAITMMNLHEGFEQIAEDITCDCPGCRWIRDTFGESESEHIHIAQIDDISEIGSIVQDIIGGAINDANSNR